MNRGSISWGRGWRLALLLALAVLLAGALSGQAAAPKLRIAIDGAYPPFSAMTPEGEMVGFDVDIARALCAAAGYDCEIVQTDWEAMIPSLVANKLDAIIASMAITDERRKVVDFTGKYYDSPARFVAARGAGLDISPDGLAGKTACVQTGTIHENYLRAEFPELALKMYRSQDEADMDFAAGRCDVLMGEGVAMSEGFLKTPEGAGFEYVGPSIRDPRWYGEGAGIAVRKGNRALADALDAAIQKIRADGTYARINGKYFDFDLYGE